MRFTPLSICALLSLVGLVGCRSKLPDSGDDDSGVEPVDTSSPRPDPNDKDGDGTPADEDCDDEDPTLNRNDVDSDGYTSCDGDCNDRSANVNPDGTDGLISDRDCDGLSGSGGSLSLSDYTFVGESERDLSGRSVSSAGDVDGDGLDDVLVGAYFHGEGGSEAGAVYVILGSSLGASRTIDLSLADYKFVGESNEDLMGLDVASAGDVDGDGLDDLLMGAHFDDDGGSDAGAAYVVLGSSLGSSLGASSTIDLSLADYKFVGESAEDNAGLSVSSAGDVDGDGLDDVLVGAPAKNSNQGVAYLILGASLGTSRTIDLSAADYKLVGDAEGDDAGRSVASAGDVDGDGLDDVLVGTPRKDDFTGRAYVVLGSSLGSSPSVALSGADYVFLGEFAEDFAGYSLSSAGDVDGDGLADVLVGAHRESSGGHWAGAGYVVLGASLGASRTINLSAADYKLVGEPESGAGRSVSSAGDVDGDGLGDVLVGAPNEDANAGVAYLILGASLGTRRTIELSSAAVALFGESDSDSAGGAVSSAGDVDGDGLDDVLVGAIGVDDGGSVAGATYLVLTGG